MSSFVASDREGRRWAVVAIDSSLRARIISGPGRIVAPMDLRDVIDTYGPLVLSPTHPAEVAAGGGCAAFVDTVDLVASDPETASIEQIDQVAQFARSIVRPDRRRA